MEQDGVHFSNSLGLKYLLSIGKDFVSPNLCLRYVLLVGGNLLRIGFAAKCKSDFVTLGVTNTDNGFDDGLTGDLGYENLVILVLYAFLTIGNFGDVVTHHHLLTVPRRYLVGSYFT